MDSRAFYDEFVERQLRMGINDRHRAILRWVKRFGLTKGQSVLEVGCGVGTVTGLLLGELGGEGYLLAVDLSPRSIEAARTRLGNPPNLELRAADILSVEIDEKFDLIVLPDVIEHIPRDRHRRLFSRLRSWLSPEGLVFLHYPNPFYSGWCAQHRPELLQHIDEPVHAHALASDAHANDLYLDFLETYSIWIREGDYVAAVLRPTAGERAFTEKEEETSLGTKLIRLIRTLAS